jgi:hypothetical protein
MYNYWLSPSHCTCLSVKLFAVCSCGVVSDCLTNFISGESLSLVSVYLFNFVFACFFYFVLPVPLIITYFCLQVFRLLVLYWTYDYMSAFATLFCVRTQRSLLASPSLSVYTSIFSILHPLKNLSVCAFSFIYIFSYRILNYKYSFFHLFLFAGIDILMLCNTSEIVCTVRDR